MAIEAEALLALSEMASQGEWSMGKAEGGYRYLDAAGIPSKPGPDRNVKWSGFARFVVEMEDDATCSGRSNLEFVAALVNAYRSGSLIHRSALAEDTARAAEGWEPIKTAPKNKAIQVYVPNLDYYGNQGVYAGMLVDMGTGPRWMTFAWAMGRDMSGEVLPTHWRPLPAPPALPLTKEAADANR